MTRPPGHAGHWGEPYQPERHSQQEPDGYGQDDSGSGDAYRYERGPRDGYRGAGSGDGYRPESGSPGGYSGPAWGYGQQQPDPYQPDPATRAFDRESWHSPDPGRSEAYHRPESYDRADTYHRPETYDRAGTYDRTDAYDRPGTYHRPDTYHGGYDGTGYGGNDFGRYADPDTTVDHRGPAFGEPSAGASRFGTPSSGTRSSGVPLDDQPTAYLPAVPTIDLGDRSTGPDRPPTGRPTAGRRPAGRSTGRLVGVVAGVTTLLVAGLLLVYGSGVEGPDAPAHPDLAEPTKVVNQWLTAMFVRKDPAEMLRYTCKREAKRSEVDKAINSVKKAERDAKAARVRITVAWSKPTEVSRNDKHARVTSTLTVTIGRRVQQTPADFGLVFESGWRVCDADMP